MELSLTLLTTLALAAQLHAKPLKIFMGRAFAEATLTLMKEQPGRLIETPHANIT